MKFWPCALLFISSPALAQDKPCPAGSTCVPPDDLKDMVSALRDQRCLKVTQPTFTLDPITVTTDRDGRVYVNGSQPNPYTLHMKWCAYEATGTGTVNAIAAHMPEPTWGWRFRVKAMGGLLFAELIEERDWLKGSDIGIAVEPFFWRILNVSGYVGARSGGGGVGIDATKNFGVYLGYALSWGTWRHNPHFALYFAF